MVSQVNCESMTEREKLVERFVTEMHLSVPENLADNITVQDAHDGIGWCNTLAELGCRDGNGR